MSRFGKNSSERFNKATMKSVSRANYLALGMDPFDDDDIALLLRFKRYEQPPPRFSDATGAAE